MHQMIMFEMEQMPDKQPLPVDIARKYGFDLQRYETEQGNYYAVQDWIAGVAQSDNPRVYWSAMKRRAKADEKQMFTACKQLPYRATDGKDYQMDFASEATLYYITQRMQSAPYVNQVLILFSQYLAQVSKHRVNPGEAAAHYDALERRRLASLGKDAKYIEDRRKSAVGRNLFTEAAKQFIFNMPGFGYAKLTDEEYQGLLGRTARQLKEATGLKNARDGMTSEAIGLLMAIESTAAQYFSNQQSVAFEDACQFMREMGEEFRPLVDSIQRRIGIDIGTGKPVLKSGKVKDAS